MKGLLAIVMWGAAATSAMAADDLTTRHGTLSIDAHNELRFKGRPLAPRLAGGNALAFVRKLAQDGKDIVLVSRRGGTACPAQYHLVTVDSAGAAATPAFGSCAELRDLRQTPNGIEITMPDYLGPHDAAAARAAAARRTVRFLFADGKVRTMP